MSSDPYFSRCDDGEKIVDRVDPVVWGDRPGPLSPEQILFYQECGYILVERLFGESELDDLRAEWRRLAASRFEQKNPQLIREPDSGDIRSVFRVHKVSDTFAALAEDPRLVDRARQILGSDVYVHQFRINFKPAFTGREFAWHSDFETWHVEDGMPRMRAVSAIVMLDANQGVNGPLFFLPGSHRRYVRCAGETPENHFESSLQKQEYGVPSAVALRELSREAGMASATGPAGSVVLFDCNLMHASTSNLSPFPRTNIFLVFNSCENDLGRPFGGRASRPEFLGERSPAR